MTDVERVRNKIRFAESLISQSAIKDAGTSAALGAIMDVLKEIANVLDNRERPQLRRAS